MLVARPRAMRPAGPRGSERKAEEESEADEEDEDAEFAEPVAADDRFEVGSFAREPRGRRRVWGECGCGNRGRDWGRRGWDGWRNEGGVFKGGEPVCEFAEVPFEREVLL
jgi:hypothetical protein